MNHSGSDIESRLWEAADELRANSNLTAAQYSAPVLGLVFLRYADHKFQVAAREIEGKSTGRRTIGPADYQARGVLYLPEKARLRTRHPQETHRGPRRGRHGRRRLQLLLHRHPALHPLVF